MSARSSLFISHPGGCRNVSQQDEAIQRRAATRMASGRVALEPLVQHLLFDPCVTAHQERGENADPKKVSPPPSSRFIILIDLRHSVLNAPAWKCDRHR